MRKSIDFQWRFWDGFQPSFLTELPKEACEVDIPHAPRVVPYHYFSEQDYQGIFTYEKVFDLPGSTDKIVRLTFEGVMLKAHAYLNGHDLGEKISGWISIVFDVTGLTKETGNRLVVIVDSREDPSIPPFGKSVDYLTFAGIYRPVHIDVLPKNHIESLHADACADGTLALDVIQTGIGTPLFRLYDAERSLVKEFTQTTLTIASPHLWSLEDPYLYSLETEFNGEKTSLSIGFRDARFQEDGFYLNGKKTKLIGLNRHQNYPYVGPAMPASAQEDDARLIRSYGCNLVRTSHYPQGEAFLSACDRLGLLVVDEIPGWQHIGEDKVWRQNFFRFLDGMIEAERDHPSLIAYGTRIDESNDDDELYSAAVALVHLQDRRRQCLGVRNFKTSHCLEDIYAYNDFSCADTRHGLDKPGTVKGAKGKPLLISEHNGHMFPTKSYDEPTRRLEQGLRHLRVLNDAFAYDRCCGAIGWCSFDYNTHQDFGAGDHICYHGVFDIFRNPKTAAFAYKSQNSMKPLLEFGNVPTFGDYDEAVTKPITLFTNVDYVEFFRGENRIGRFYPDTKDYPDLPHPPIIIDDFIGETFHEKGFTKHQARKITEALNLVGQEGFAHLKVSQILKYLPTLIGSHSLSFEKLTMLYCKYLAGWGEKNTVYAIKGYIDGKEVIARHCGPIRKKNIVLTATKDTLQNADTYDVVRVSLEAVDEYGNHCPYADDAVSFETTGPLSVIGPKEAALVGGSLSCYLRSMTVGKEENGTLRVKTTTGTTVLKFRILPEIN